MATRTPDLLTTAEYLEDAVFGLGNLEYIHDVHQVTTVDLEPTSLIPEDHVLEVKLTVPLIKDPDTESLRAKGARTLELMLVSAPKPKRTEHISGAATISSFGSEFERRLYASAIIGFNTKRVLTVDGRAWYEGLQLGITDPDVNLPTNKNVLLAYMAGVFGIRSMGVYKAAEFTAGMSAQTGRSFEESVNEVNFNKWARQIAIETGKPVPPSLQRPPQVKQTTVKQIVVSSDTPSYVKQDTQIDSYDYAARQRSIATWEFTKYIGFLPDNPDHLGFYDVLHADESATGLTVGIDVRQWKSSAGEKAAEEQYAQSAEEARAMIAPFIHAASGLRRYYNRATKDIAA